MSALLATKEHGHDVKSLWLIYILTYQLYYLIQFVNFIITDSTILSVYVIIYFAYMQRTHYSQV